MVNALRAETLKLRRSFVRRLTLLAPCFFLLLALPSLLILKELHLSTWQLLLSQIFNWWPVIFIPLGTALIAALAHAQEVKSGGYRAMRLHDLPPARLWLAKIGALALHTLAASAILTVVTLLVGAVIARGEPPLLQMACAAGLIWLTALALIPLQLWVAAWGGMAASVGLGLVGSVGGVLLAATPYWLLCPWSWPVRLMCPILGVHPNGVLLDPASPLLDAGVLLPGVLVSLAAFALFSAMTALAFARREVA